uniref:Uncharacterized protein n=1 Tax=Trypanosoma congolense (strain IL3000) TaxID=1068625 RepID=G0UX05_TRYCI|nr:conserved hypothetical protein [Trypanosoma congolense IL3000]
MGDLELSELISKFQAIQREDVPNQITERNVVEIINVLREKRLVELLYTFDGKEYLTWEQLRREVIDEIYVNGGRINVVDIHGALNVDMIHVERVLPKVLEEPNIRVESSELITDEYLESVVQSARDALKEHGFISILSFAKTYRFTSLFTQELLTGAINTGRLHAVVQNSTLYTKQFVGAQAIVLRAGLLAATQPVNLTAFFNRHDLFAPLMDTLIEVIRGDLPGKVEGCVYTPTYYEQNRIKDVENVYLSNGFIDYDLLRQKGIGQAKEFLVSKFNPVADAAVTQGGGKRRTRRGQVPPMAAAGAPLVARNDSYPNAGHALSACFLSDRSLANLAVFEDLAQGDAVAVDLSQHLPVSVDFVEDADILLGRLRELHPVVGSCTLLESGVLLHESVLASVKKQLEVSYGARTAEGGAEARRKLKGNHDFGKEEEDILMNVIAEVTGLSQEEYGDMIAGLSSEWMDVAKNIYTELASAAEQNVSLDWKRMRNSSQSSLGAAWSRMVIAEKGVVWAASKLDDAACVALNRHLLTTVAQPLLSDIFLNESLGNAKIYERMSELLQEQGSQRQNYTALLQKALKIIPEEQRQCFSTLVDAAAGKSVEAFMNILRDMNATAQISVSSFHKLSKGVERETLALMRNTVKERVARDTFSTDVSHSGVLFASLCSLLIHLHFHVHVDLPGRVVGSVVTYLLAEVGESVGRLKECNQIITNAISGKQSLSDEDLAELEALRQSVCDST